MPRRNYSNKKDYKERKRVQEEQKEAFVNRMNRELNLNKTFVNTKWEEQEICQEKITVRERIIRNVKKILRRIRKVL